MAHCIPDEIGSRVRAPRGPVTRSSGRPAGRSAPTTACPRSSGCRAGFPSSPSTATRASAPPTGRSTPIDRYAGDRPLAWVDDCIDASCEDWATMREAPTLLVPTDPTEGLTDAHVEALLSWARRGLHCLTGGGVLADLLPRGDPEDPDRRPALPGLVGDPPDAGDRGGAAGGRGSTRSGAAPQAPAPRGPRRGPHAPDALPLPECPPAGRFRVLTPPAPARAATAHARGSAEPSEAESI